MTTCTTTIDKAVVTAARKNNIARILFIRKLNAFLAQVGKALNAAGAIHTK